MELKQRLGDPSQLIGAQQQKIVAAPKKSLAVAQPSAAAQSKPLPPTWIDDVRRDTKTTGKDPPVATTLRSTVIGDGGTGEKGDGGGRLRLSLGNDLNIERACEDKMVKISCKRV
ncbi:hypothetical protein RHGRI_010682 [Rhododendron griersonianum]|uniref:Uncharacterized protein n=1 Tax=Rhododendron griersonianum TaxID=479676 RepID=A0AAV6JXF6_9ERIC|nr:hypothetical protein RHGRI_017344 [Rhododendron griersonianum]KAG5545978.1 hypothetical protein RHGRI_018219 [Rhododendron griersonianum]KAG5552664.1 hypothetical protein RHGRI_010682 [Rhododendron griersonianum]